MVITNQGYKEQLIFAVPLSSLRSSLTERDFHCVTAKKQARKLRKKKNYFWCQMFKVDFDKKEDFFSLKAHFLAFHTK